MMKEEYIKPGEVSIINIENSKWNCDKCLFFDSEKVKCKGHKRLLYGNAIGEDCEDGLKPFVKISTDKNK